MRKLSVGRAVVQGDFHYVDGVVTFSNLAYRISLGRNSALFPWKPALLLLFSLSRCSRCGTGNW